MNIAFPPPPPPIIDLPTPLVERVTDLLFYGFKVYLHVRTTKYLATTKRSKILNNQAAEWCKTNSTSQQILKI